MGLSLSPHFAEVFMGNLEDQIMKGLPHKPKIWSRYVDDIFVIAERSYLTDLFNYINSLNNHIKFTMEDEENCELAFRDVLVKRNNYHNSLSFKVHMQEINTNRALHTV